MIFGEKFYPSLAKLSPWRQSLFALALAQRQAANFALFASIAGLEQAQTAFTEALKTLWTFHQDKFNHIDLEAELAKLEPFTIDPEEYLGENGEVTVGALLAVNAQSALTAAFDAILMKEGNEAEIASKSSLSGVVLACEDGSEEALSDDDLRELELVDLEVNFQISIFDFLLSAQRSLDAAHFMLKVALKDYKSNVGISYEDAGLSLSYDNLKLDASELSARDKQDCSCRREARRVPKAKSSGTSSRKKRRDLDKKRTLGRKKLSHA